MQNFKKFAAWFPKWLLPKVLSALVGQNEKNAKTNGKKTEHNVMLPLLHTLVHQQENFGIGTCNTKTRLYNRSSIEQNRAYKMLKTYLPLDKHVQRACETEYQILKENILIISY